MPQKPSIYAIAAALLLSLPATQAAACCACDPPRTAEKVGVLVTANIRGTIVGQAVKVLV